MKRRQFIKQSASLAGLSFVGCGLGTMAANESHDAQRRQVMVNGKRMLTVDIHCHSYVHDVWPLIEEYEDLGYLRSVVDNEHLRKKIDLNNVDFRATGITKYDSAERRYVDTFSQASCVRE